VRNFFSGDSLKIQKVDPEEFKRLVAKGLSPFELARHFNVKPRTIYYWEAKLGIKAKRKAPAPKINPFEFEQLYLEGADIRHLMRHFNCSRRLVYYWIEKLGLPLRRPQRKRTKIDHDKFRELYLKGLSYEELAKIFKTTPATLRNLRCRLNLPPRVKRSQTKMVFEMIEEAGFISKQELLKRLGLSRSKVDWHIRKLRSWGLIGRVRLKAGRSGLLSETLYRAGLSNRTYYYTDAEKFAEFLAEQLVMNLQDHSDFARKCRTLKLSLRNVLPIEVYRKIQKYL